MKQPELDPGKLGMVQVPVLPLLLKQQRVMGTLCWRRQVPTRKDLTTRLSPSPFRPVSLRYDTIKGHTPTMFATTSTRPGMDSSLVMMTLRKAGREAIQSWVSATFRRFTKNSVSENGSRLPKTNEAVRWRQRFISRRSNVGIQLVLSGTRFQDNSRMPRLAQEDLREETPQHLRDQLHPEFCPKLSPPRWCWH